jgi:hypothetical protein
MYPRFFSSVSRGRCLYACDRGFVGFTHDLQNKWSDNFSFMQVRMAQFVRYPHCIEFSRLLVRGSDSWLGRS